MPLECVPNVLVLYLKNGSWQKKEFTIEVNLHHPNIITCMHVCVGKKSYTCDQGMELNSRICIKLLYYFIILCRAQQKKYELTKENECEPGGCRRFIKSANPT